MTNLSLGEHSKLTANPAERGRVRKFYTQGIRKNRYLSHHDRLLPGCRVPRLRSQRGGWLESIWLELRTPEPETRDFGVCHPRGPVLGQGTLLFPSSGWTGLSFSRKDGRHVEVAAIAAGHGQASKGEIFMTIKKIQCSRRAMRWFALATVIEPAAGQSTTNRRLPLMDCQNMPRGLALAIRAI